MRQALVDLSPLRASPDFRRLWIGSSLATLGSQFTVFAVLLQVWQLTHSPVWTGAIGLAHALPMLALSLVGGSLADSVDRRTLVLVTSTGQLVATLALVAQASLGLESPLLVLVLVAVQTSFVAMGSPARRTFVTRLLPEHLVASGLALTQIGFQVSLLLGPTTAGLVAAGFGLEVCYAVDAATFLAAMYGVVRLPSLKPLATEEDPGSTAGRIAAGLAFVVRRPLLRGAFLTDLSATVLAMPVALFPMVNEERFGGSPRTLGLLLTAIGLGGVLASVFSGGYTRAVRPGRVMLVAATAWGAGIVVFGLAPGLAVTLLSLVVAGAADTVTVVSRATLTQLATPDSLRGRVAAVEGVVGMTGADLGNVRAGMVAAWTSPAVALVAGGLMCVAGVAAVAWRNVEVRGFRVAREEVSP